MAHDSKNRLSVTSTVQDVQLSRLRIAPEAQRELRPGRVDYLAAEFDPEDFGIPVVSYRDGHYNIVDGQHRIEAVKRWLGDGWEKQSISCRVYKGLTLKGEADYFDRLNDALAVAAFDKFKVRVTAGRSDETAVKKTVEQAGLVITRDKRDGAVSSVGTLVKIHKRAGDVVLKRSLKIVHSAFGTPGLTNNVIDGVARLCERYNGGIDDGEAVSRLHEMRGGVGALMTRAGTLRKQTGQSLPICIAAATVDVLNAKHGGKKIPSWWKE